MFQMSIFLCKNSFSGYVNIRDNIKGNVPLIIPEALLKCLFWMFSKPS